MLLMTAAVEGWLGYQLPFALPFNIPVVSVPADLAKWIVVGSAIALLLFSILLLLVTREFWDRSYATTLSFIVGLGTLGGLYGAALAWNLVEPRPSLPYQVPLWAMVLSPRLWQQWRAG